MRPVLLLSLLALLVSSFSSPASATPSDPRVAINAVNTPGDDDAYYRITHAGSYYLEANLVGVNAKHGIEIAASDVRIDLMGFELLGTIGGLDGVHVQAGLVDPKNIVIHGGTVANWPGYAIRSDFAVGVDLRDIQIRHIGSGGILTGPASSVRNCVVGNVGGIGIQTGRDSLVSDCIVTGLFNGSGISVDAASLVRSCIVRQVGQFGIHAPHGGSVLGCRVTGALSHGIHGDRVTVAECTVTSSGGTGISLEHGTVRGCDVSSSTGTGIAITVADGLVVGNQVVSNGGDGIHVASGARVEQNDVRNHANGFGIRVVGVRSFVVKNSLFANAGSIQAQNSGNFVGPIVNVNAVNGRENPWANIQGN